MSLLFNPLHSSQNIYRTSTVRPVKLNEDTMADNPINWQDCIKQSNNKPKLAQQLLNMLALELPEFKQAITTSFKQDDTPTLIHHIHKLHGACCYCGANQLKSMLNNIENHIQDYTPQELEIHIQALLVEIDAVQQALATQSYKS